MKKNKPSGYFDPDQFRDRLSELDPVKIAHELSRLEPAQQREMFRQIEDDRAVEVFCLLDAAHQENILTDLTEDRAAYLVEELDPDDRARLFTELSRDFAEKLLAGLSPAERLLTIQLLDYPEESAGRIMTPEYVSLQPDMTAAEALQRVREQAETAETLHSLPVVDHDGRLSGMLDLSELVLAAAETRVSAILAGELRSVRADTDQETVARLLQAADLLAVPVVDAGERLLGLVTVDDAMDVLTREEEEDISRAGGAEPLRRPYFSVSDRRLARSRVVWLLVLIVAATLTVQVLNTFEQTLEQAVALAMFIPLLIGTGGNAGAQSSTTLVRSMAVGDVYPRDFLKTVWREARVGLLLGLMLGALSFVPVWLYAGRPLAMVVSLTLVSICTLASAVGASMPLLARTAGVDPAVASAPFVTTVVDASGLLVYFLIARAILQL